MPTHLIKILRIFTAGLLFALFLFAAAGISVMLDETLSSKWWIFALASIPIALVLYFPLWQFWRWLLGTSSQLLSITCQLILFAPVLFCLMLFINVSFARSGESTALRGVIVRGSRDESYHSRRISRMIYSRGAPYYEYTFDIKLDNQSIKSVDVPYGLYRHSYVGDSIEIRVFPGGLGMDIIDPVTVDCITAAERMRRYRNMIPFKLEFDKTRNLVRVAPPPPPPEKKDSTETVK